MAHIYLRVMPPEAEDILSSLEIINNLRARTQFIKDSWFTQALAIHPRGGLHFGIDDSFIDLEEVVQNLNSVGYIFVI
ncbi:MAG: hypothetical protein AAF298_17435 [Cyanobacteria bacterium P01_A01_bin.40]